MTKYDIIGDIHGCATELTTLLVQLGYRREDAGIHRHPERTAVFVGDLAQSSLTEHLDPVEEYDPGDGRGRPAVLFGQI